MLLEGNGTGFLQPAASHTAAAPSHPWLVALLLAALIKAS